MKNREIKVVELFAGVGGFRLGLEKNNFKIIWSNQWEPSTKIQHASIVYESNFGNINHSNEDINQVLKRNIEEIPDHDLLVGGFPCQDYSVATTLNNSKGLKGKKGILWWSIHKILETKKKKTKYLLLENVDRLLKSPSTQRGRDFAIMLKSLDDLGYAVEWRVINAADFGMPQRRKRIFIIGYHKSTNIYKKILKNTEKDWILNKGVISNAFPCEDTNLINEFLLNEDIIDISNKFNKNGKISPFENSGIFIKNKVYTIKTKPIYNGNNKTLGDILEKNNIPSEFFIDNNDKNKWEYLKGAKKEERITKEGFKYNYSEGGMIFPDLLDKPSRTIITGEGGKSASRFKHVISTEKGLRRLLPIELERLNMFPDNHTKLIGISDTKRAFLMGNALVVGIVEKIGKELYNQITNE